MLSLFYCKMFLIHILKLVPVEEHALVLGANGLKKAALVYNERYFPANVRFKSIIC